MLHKIFCLLLAAVTAASLVSCGQKPEPEPAAAASESSAPEAASSMDEAALEEAGVEKFNAYVAVNNLMYDRLDLVINSYFNYVAVQEEFSLSDPDYWCNSLPDSAFAKVEEAYKYAGEQPSMGEIDAAYLALYPVMRELMDALNEVYTYTDMKSYLDDDYARGRELHAVIWKNIENYYLLGDSFMLYLEAEADARRRADLELYKQEGQMAHYYMIAMMMTLQEIQTGIYAQGVTDETLTELDLEPLQPLYDRFLSELEEGLKYLQDEEQLLSEGLSSSQLHFYLDGLTETKVSLSELFQRVREQRPLSSSDWIIQDNLPVDGSIGKFEQELSGLISSYNSL